MKIGIERQATAAATWNPRSIAEPKYTGLLVSAPSVVGNAQDIVAGFTNYSQGLAKLVGNVSKLYDVTSTYFEGEASANAQAQRGYSRDHRPDCKQVCIALVVTFDGFPLGYEVFAGNTNDSRTLQTIVATLEARHGVVGRVWITDRGMAGAKNLAWLEGFPFAPLPVKDGSVLWISVPSHAPADEIFVDGSQGPEYVPWTDVEKVEFDRPPAMYPPLGGR